MAKRNGWVALKKLELRLFKKRNWVLTFFLVYLSLLAVFSVIGDRGLWASFKVWRKLRAVEVANEKLRDEVGRLQKDAVAYRSDLRTVEKYAREELNMHGQNEIEVVFE